MTKWEYLVVKRYSDLRVTEINGKPAPTIEVDNSTWLGGRGARNLKLHEYLEEAGKNNWEVCGSLHQTDLCIILKRPLAE